MEEDRTFSGSNDLSKLSDIIESFSDKNNVNQWDLGASLSKDHSVQVDKGEAKQLKAAQRSNITIRVWNKKGLVGTTSTSDLSHIGLKKAFDGALQASNYGNPNDVPNFSPSAKSNLPNIVKPIKKFQGIKSLLQTLKVAEEELLSINKSIINVPYNGLSESYYERIYANSDGAYRYIESSQASLYLYAKAQNKGCKPRSSGSIRIAYGVEDLEINSCIKEAASKTISHLNYRPIDTGNYLVCFKPEAFLELIGAFSSMFNARSILDGLSLSTKDSLGKRVSVPGLTLHDNAIHPSNYSSSTFDGEGTPTGNLCLINSGILENFLHSEATARQFGVNPTGHAGLGSKVSVGADWLVVSRTNDYLESNKTLQHDVYKDPFVLIEGLNALHAGVKASQGSFSLPFDGWFVQDGELISIEAATVAGDIRKVLNNIVQIESKQLITHQGLSPHIWVEGLSITGEE